MKTRDDKTIKVPRQNQLRNSRSIELHIGELVLHGFSPAERRPIAESVEHELRRLLTNEDFASPNSFTADRVDGKSFPLAENRRHESTGAEIARAIYGGLRR